MYRTTLHKLLLAQNKRKKNAVTVPESNILRRVAEMRKQQEDFEETDTTTGQTAKEDEDAWENELDAFTPAKRVSEADEANNQKSLDRALSRKLTLLVKQKLGPAEHWCFPQSKHLEGESMRQAAERTLKEMCGDVEALFIGNAPCGVYKYSYPKDVQSEEKFDGAKVFFYKAQLKGGQIETNKSEISDHLWLTKEELLTYPSRNYSKTINQFVFEL